jgi:hypothetical protein
VLSLEAAMDVLRPLSVEVRFCRQVPERGWRMVVAGPDGRALELNETTTAAKRGLNEGVRARVRVWSRIGATLLTW